VSTDVLELLKKAINEQRYASVRYHEGGARVVEPHAAYKDEQGRLMVDCYQTGGYSASGRKPPFWKRLRVNKIASVSLLDDTFEPRLTEGFKPTKPRYKQNMVAIVGAGKPCFLYSPEALKEMGPFLPEGVGRYR